MNTAAVLTAMFCLWNSDMVKHEKDIRLIHDIIAKAQRVKPVHKDEALALWAGFLIWGKTDKLITRGMPTAWKHARQRLVQQSLAHPAD